MDRMNHLAKRRLTPKAKSHSSACEHLKRGDHLFQRPSSIIEPVNQNRSAAIQRGFRQLHTVGDSATVRRVR